MRSRRFGFKPSKREHALGFNATMDFMRGASDSAKAQDAPRLAVPPLRSRRGARAISDLPLEAEVIRAVGQLLAVHPKVLFAVRQNSGAASYEAKSGKYAPVHFYSILTRQAVTITDFWGIMRDGRMLALEAKREDFIEPRTEREFRQWAFLTLVRNCGGVSGFVRTADEAKALLDA